MNEVDSARALRESEELQGRLTLALEAAAMGTWDWQVSTGEMAWSPETHRIFGDASRDRYAFAFVVSRSRAPVRS